MKKKKQVTAILTTIKKNSKYLLVKRHCKSKLEANKWGFRGEAIEYGESPEQALIRGVKDEVSLEIKSWKLLKVYSKFFENREKQRHAIIISYICDPAGTNVKINEELSDFEWVFLDQIRERDLVKGNDEIIRDLENLFHQRSNI